MALLVVPWVSLQFVIVVFPVHTHLLFSNCCHTKVNYFMSQTPQSIVLQLLWLLVVRSNISSKTTVHLMTQRRFPGLHGNIGSLVVIVTLPSHGL